MSEAPTLDFRPLDQAHLAAWRDWVNDPEIAGFLDRVLPVTQAEHEAFYADGVVKNRDAVWFAIHAADGRFIGIVWLWNINRRHAHAEVRVLIGERSYWQRGAGTQALLYIARYALRQLNLHKVYAYVMQRNPRARAAFEKAGFELEATFARECFWEGAYHDVWRLTKGA